MPFVINYYSQQDPQWKNVKLGFDETLTLGSDGCVVTSLTMLANGHGYSETPESFNQKLKSLGPGRAFLGGLMVWNGVPLAFPRLKFRRILLSRDQPAPLSAIDDSLNAGFPVIAEVDRSLAQGLQNHWVVLYGKKGDDYLMLDPWPYPSDTKEMTVTTRYGFGRKPAEVITALVFYEGPGVGLPGPQPGGTPATVETDMIVRVALGVDSGLRLRSQPTTDSDTLTIEPAGAPLRVLEPVPVAQPKIGVFNQWLRVRNQAGVEGYVAAWYVELVSLPAPAPSEPAEPVPPTPTEPVPAPEPVPPPQPAFSVFVMNSVGERGLRMRDQPSLGGSLVTVANAGAQLAVLEPEDQAREKLGKQEQWLHVRDENGRSGYVAAWLVGLSAEAEPAPTPEPEPAPVAEPAPPVTEPTPEPQPETGPVTQAGDLVVFVNPAVASRGLRVRSAPSLGGSLVTIVEANAPLTVLEPAATAREKVGVQNQWLNIRDAKGKTGYVAAWFVMEQTAQPVPSVPQAPGAPTAPSSLTVYVSGLASRGLRMRSTPTTGSSTMKILDPRTPLTVLEPAEPAINKIGIFNEWLHVRDPRGVEGYVAAWYVYK